VLSPFSIHSAFSMVLLGSGGETRTQLEEVLGATLEDSREGYTALNARLLDNQNSVGADLRLANKVFLADDFTPKQTYMQMLRNRFFSGVEEKNFGNQKSKSIREINDFVAQETNDKIQDLLSDDSVDSLTKMILINAIYFKADWAEAFSTEETHESTFRTPSGEVQVPTMTMETKLRLMEDKNNKVKILELPYGNSNKSMLIVLPDEGQNDLNISKTLKKIDVSQVRKERLDTTRVFLPRFKMKFQTFLKVTMNNLGAPDVFTDGADLSGISDLPLYVSDGIHQAFIEVNEEGTEAAAATAILVGLRTARRTKVFRANRPFVFMIWDFDENIPIFAGKLVDPTNSVLIQTRSAAALDDVRPEVVRTTTQRVPHAKPEFCSRYFRDFANALDNVRICDRQKDNTEWMARNAAGCNKSNNVVNNFSQNNCGEKWCARFRGEEADREKEFRERCDSKVPTGSDRIYCRSIQNHFTAQKYLKC